MVQKRAIQSWLDMNFKVHSLNILEEAVQVREDFPNIECYPQQESGFKLTGKPVIFVNEILNFFSKKSCSRLGIINSDIVLDVSEYASNQIYEYSNNAFFFGQRLEVIDLDSKSGEVDPWGFDYFFFDKAFVDIWPQSQFCLGMPFWDHWFPLLPILHGKKVFRPRIPIGRHIPHTTSRDNSFFRFNDEFASTVIKLMSQSQHTPLSDIHQKFGSDFPKENYFRLQKKIAISEAQGISDGEHIEDLSRFFDYLTKYVVNFLKNNSEVV
jgi:hypothetical protein